MTFTEAVDRELLDSLVADGWLRSQRHPDADLWIYNYTERTQWSRHWTSQTLMCRGLILDGAGSIVARPFGKFFNLGEPDCPQLPIEEPHRITEKIDGSLCIGYMLDHEWHLATRGSFVSEQAKEAERILAESERGIGVTSSTVTPLFEVVYPDNRIVVDYGDRRELVFLAGVDKYTGLDAGGVGWDGPKAAELAGSHALEKLQELARPNAEGFVINFFNAGIRVKVKFEEYVRLHRLISGLNARHIWECLRMGSDIAAMLVNVPDEIYAWAVRQCCELQAEYDRIEQRARAVFDQRPLVGDEERRIVAEYFKSSGAHTGVLFKMLDDRPYRDLIWRAIEPAAEVPA